MPLLDIHLVKGRTESEIDTLLQAIHDTVVQAFGVPVRDRYHIVTEHESGRLVMLDTGLGFERSDRRVLIHLTSRPRTRAAKQEFYELLVLNLGQRAGVPPEDVMVSLSQNGDEDWSFGRGRAQYLTGDL